MRRTLALASFVLLAACGKSEAPPGPIDGPPVKPPPAVASTEAFEKEGAPGATAVVEAYLAAAKAQDGAAMYALGTPEWREKEAKKRRGYTPGYASKQIVLKTATVRDPEVEGDTARISVKVGLLIEGKDDGDSMRFVLVRRDGRWWINELG